MFISLALIIILFFYILNRITVYLDIYLLLKLIFLKYHERESFFVILVTFLNIFLAF